MILKTYIMNNKHKAILPFLILFANAYFYHRMSLFRYKIFSERSSIPDHANNHQHVQQIINACMLDKNSYQLGRTKVNVHIKQFSSTIISMRKYHMFIKKNIFIFAIVTECS
jgi:myosin heavy subunit